MVPKLRQLFGRVRRSEVLSEAPAHQGELDPRQEQRHPRELAGMPVLRLALFHTGVTIGAVEGTPATPG